MSTKKLHLYHTNDLHSHLEQWPKIMAYLNGQRAKLEADNETMVCFDIGDHADRYHPVTEGTEGRGNVQLMNEAGFLNATIGNNEGITFSKKQLDTLYKEANFQVLVANLQSLNGDRPLWAKPYDIHSLQNGLKIGVIGVTAPFQAYYRLLGWNVLEPIIEIKECLTHIRDQVDIVIVLSHLGLEADKQLAREVDDVDIILGSHTHHVLLNGLHQDGTTIGQAGKFGSYVGRMEIVWDSIQEKIQSVEAECIDIKHHTADKNSEQNLNQLCKVAERNLQEVVTELKDPLELDWFQSSPFPMLLSKAIKEWCHAEVGMINAGLLLEPLKAGVITKGDLHRVCPHPINPCKIQLKGAYFKELIQHVMTKEMTHLQIKGLGFRGKVMGRMIFDGVEVDGEILSDGEFHVYDISINGSALDYNRIYSVGTVDMFTFGPLLPSVAYAQGKSYYLPEMLRDILAWKLKTIER